jgi:hypothetical protein
MFLLDDLLLAPGKAALFLFKELAKKAQEEWLDDDSIKQELQEIYTMLESGRISDKEFEARECRLLERLEQIAKVKFAQKWGGEAVIDVAPAQPSLPPVPAEEPPPCAIAPASAGAAAPSPAAAALPTFPWLEEAFAKLCEPLGPEFAPPDPQPVVTTSFAASFLDAPPPPRVATPHGIPSTSVAPVGQSSAWTTQARQAPLAPVPPQAPMAPMAPVAPHAPVAPVAPQVPWAPVAPDAPMSSSARLTITQVIDRASQALAMLKLRVSTITSVSPDEGGWRVTAELVERRGVPDTNDLLGLYELRLDESGNVVRYERTHMRRRADLGR